MGQDATKSLDDLITALGRSSPMILDNLGLSVKLGEANEKYAQKLGKTAGKDKKAQKATYPSIVGLEKSRKIATQLTGKAFAALGIFKGRAVALESLAEYLLKRDR